MDAKSAPAICVFHWLIIEPERFCRATVTGWIFVELLRVTAKRNSFHIFVNCHMETTTKLGKLIGRKIYQ